VPRGEPVGKPLSQRKSTTGVVGQRHIPAGRAVTQLRKSAGHAGHCGSSLGSVVRNGAAPSAAGWWPRSAAEGAASLTGSTVAWDSFCLAISEMTSGVARTRFLSDCRATLKIPPPRVCKAVRSKRRFPGRRVALVKARRCVGPKRPLAEHGPNHH
jgi:hypothetical protein